jgi:hypothetical protein
MQHSRTQPGRGAIPAYRELQRLRAENERLRNLLAVGRENRRDLWAALALIREAVETLAPIGAIRSSEAVMGQDGPEPHHEAAELVRGIQAIAEGRGGGWQIRAAICGAVT